MDFSGEGDSWGRVLVAKTRALGPNYKLISAHCKNVRNVTVGM